MSLAVALSDAFASRPDPAAVPAASIAVAVDQQTVIEAWGAKTSTLFQAASISKPVAAMVALRLVADGRLDLDADVNRFLASWQLPGDAGVSVTVRHLLCHGGGLSVNGFPGYRQDQALPSLADILDGRPPSNTPAVRREDPPGREWRYSGGGYQVLQQLLEDVTGRAFADLAGELVLRPAGMSTATYAQPDPADAAAPHIAGRPEVWMIYPELAAAGLPWCTPTDLLHLAQAIQAAVAGEPGAVLPQDLAEQMVTPQLGDSGLGLGIGGDGDRRNFSHAGGNYGYRCAMLGAVNTRNAAVLMTNSDQGLSVATAMAAAIMASTSWQIT